MKLQSAVSITDANAKHLLCSKQKVANRATWKTAFDLKSSVAYYGMGMENNENDKDIDVYGVPRSPT